MNILDTQKELVKTLSYLIDGKIKNNNKKSTTVISGRIKCVDGKDKFTVTINQKDYSARSHFNHAVRDVVYVLVPNGNWSNLFIVY